MTDNDGDLRDRFAALRRQEEAQAPGFTGPTVSGRKQLRPRSPSILIAAAACLVSIAAAGLWLRTSSHRPQSDLGKPAASIMEWIPPTDFLLVTPGHELLETVPAIGTIRTSLIARTTRHKNPKVGRPVLP
jgi:hypothetical protein